MAFEWTDFANVKNKRKGRFGRRKIQFKSAPHPEDFVSLESPPK